MAPLPPVLIARDVDGTTFLEVHHDLYGDSSDQTPVADAIAYGRGLKSARKSPLWQETVQWEEGIGVPLYFVGRPYSPPHVVILLRPWPLGRSRRALGARDAR